MKRKILKFLITSLLVFSMAVPTFASNTSYLNNYTPDEISEAKSYLTDVKEIGAALVYHTLLDSGFSETATLGIMAVMIQVDESFSGTTETSEGVGICNFNVDELNAFAADSGESWPNVSLETQLDFMLTDIYSYWISNEERVAAFESIYGSSYIVRTVDKLKNIGNALQAAICFDAGYMSRHSAYDTSSGNLSAEVTKLDNTIYILSYVKNDFGAAATSIVYDYTLDAILYALDDSHGYMNVGGNNMGTPDFDCGGLITVVLRDVGILPYSAGIYEPNDGLETLPLYYGFESLNCSADDLEMGDILYRYGHTEIYIGNGLIVGARNDQGNPASGDQDGNEVSVHSLSDFGAWEAVYRYSE